MQRMIIDLGEKLKLLTLKNNVIVELAESSYYATVLDFIYSRLRGYEIEEVIIITRNMLSTCLYPNAGVSFVQPGSHHQYVSVYNKDDLNTLKTLCESSGVKRVTCVDMLGLIFRLGKTDICYCDRVDGMNRLCCINGDKVQDYCVCGDTSFDSRLQKFIDVNRLTGSQWISEYSDVLNLMYFDNGSMLISDEQSVKDLSVFAYALQEEKYRYNISEEKLESTEEYNDSESKEVSSTHKEPVVSVTEDLFEDPSDNYDFEDDIYDAQEDFAVKEPKEKKNKDPLIVNIVAIAGFIMLISATVMAAFNFYLDSRVVELAKERDKLDTSIKQQVAQNNTYSACLTVDSDTDFGYLSSVSDILKKSKCTLLSLAYTGDGTNLKVSCTSEKKAIALQNTLSELYSGDVYNITKEGKSNFVLVITHV